MSTDLFRKSALARLASPDQLDQILRVTTPRNWLALLGVCLLLAVSVAWGCLASIPTTVAGQGWIQAQEAILYMPAEMAQMAKPGQAAQVAPAGIQREEYGFIVGSVKSIDRTEITQKGMEVRVSLAQDSSTPSGYRWSSSRGPELTFPPRTVCNVSIITREQRPYALVLPWMRGKLGL